MHTHFKYVQMREEFGKRELAEALGKEEGIIDIVSDALNVADSAACFFRGYFSPHAPNNPEGNFIYLPWHKDYWIPWFDGVTASPAPIFHEAERIATMLLDAREFAETTDLPWQQITRQSEDLTFSKKIMMQSIAVETMLSVEGFLDLVSKTRAIEAMIWLSSAYQNLIECTGLAHTILSPMHDR